MQSPTRISATVSPSSPSRESGDDFEVLDEEMLFLDYENRIKRESSSPSLMFFPDQERIAKGDA
jgi:hypothetical protein